VPVASALGSPLSAFRNPCFVHRSNRTVCLPYFIVIGAFKSGTTTLWHLLNQHDNLHLPKQKELRFFCQPRNSQPTPEILLNYASNFPAIANSRLLTGEASPTYLFFSHVPALVRALLPKVKLVALLREPVARAWSAFAFLNTNRMTPLKQSFYEQVSFEIDYFQACLQSHAAQLCYDSIVQNISNGALELERFFVVLPSMYFYGLRYWYKHFDHKQILLLFSEQLRSDTRRSMKKLTQFLDIPPLDEKAVNISAEWNVNRSAKIARLLAATDRAAGLEKLRRFLTPHTAHLCALYPQWHQTWKLPCTGDLYAQ